MLPLYTALGNGPALHETAPVLAVLAHPGTEVFGAFGGDRLGAMVTLHLLPNATWSARPYGLIENVVTLPDLRGLGFGRAAMQAALHHAEASDAYKVMLLTGTKRTATGFYEKLGFSSDSKTGMQIRWAAG